MPLIHVRAFSGRDMEMKKNAAQAMVKAASEAMNTPETAFTVIFDDIEDREAWKSGGEQAIVEPLRDKILIEHGKLL